MFHFCQAMATLIERIKRAAEGVVRLVEPLNDQPLTGTSVNPCIDWFDAQPVYPKLYWQSRDGYEEVVALGQQVTFSDPMPAYAILQDDQRIWGCRAFDGQADNCDTAKSSFFFLPHLELIRTGEYWSLAVNLHAGKETVIKVLQQLISEYLPVSPITSGIVSVRHTPTKDGWHTLVKGALNDIQAQLMDKVVLARQTTVTFDSACTAAQVLKASQQENRHSFHFLLALDARRAFLGSTPERLYRREGRRLQTEALAGTIGRGTNGAHDQRLGRWLCLDAKNLQENQYVVDDILERIRPYTDSVTVDESVSLVRLRQVQHLKRHISGVLQPDVCGAKLLHALQPTAAVAGLPRQQAMQFILNHEPFERGWYAGSLGYVSLPKAEFCVALRSAYLMDEKLQLYAGAGIVQGSDPASEWQEVDKKMSTLLSLFTDVRSDLPVSEVA
ncbi:isochorismate synthase [Photobacterium galatheae]|uniref:Isochorismate synthase MenF n=1 Tax=Photobacterium galatheae TaxID=1654360 RepID=A0A066RSC5_9GAMM|nr:isochorismate synthase [Photobacterium galatheae]